MQPLLDQPFLAGAFVSLSVAVPVGPIALLCIGRTVRDGFAQGVASGLGAASVHLAYGLLALSGLGVVGDVLRANAGTAQVAGGALILMFALRLLFRPAPAAAGCVGATPSLLAYATAAGMAFANPLTILGLAAGLAALGLIGSGLQWMVLAGMFCGSALWWVVLCGTVAAFGRRLAPGASRRLNRGACAAMAAIGLVSMANAL